MIIFLLLLTINVLWLQPSNTVLRSPVSTVAHATTHRMMASNVDALGTTQESIARKVRFSGTTNVAYWNNVCVTVHACYASVSHIIRVFSKLGSKITRISTKDDANVYEAKWLLIFVRRKQR